jgi:hypothetical protein
VDIVQKTADPIPAIPVRPLDRFCGSFFQNKRMGNQKGCKYLLHAGFFLGLFFEPEDGGYMFIRNVGLLSADYTALYRRR